MSTRRIEKFVGVSTGLLLGLFWATQPAQAANFPALADLPIDQSDITPTRICIALIGFFVLMKVTGKSGSRF